MTTKLTLTLSVDEEVLAPDQVEKAMSETLALLTANGLGPTNKITFVLAFDDEEDAHERRSDIKATLGGRPVGIVAELKFEAKEGIDRTKVVRVTPMDRAGWN